MNQRFEIMQTLLTQGRFFKLVCGAGNENTAEVHKLSVIYTLAGANGLDVSATPDIVKACVTGIEEAYKLANDLDITIPVRPFITVSVGMSGDHHVRKAEICTEACNECGLCIPICPTDAIDSEYIIQREKCIGCGHCESVCPPKVNAIRYEHNEKGLEEILPLCLQAGAENIELHAAVPGDDAIIKEWKMVNRILPDHFVSMCLDRLHLSDSHLMNRIRKAYAISQNRLIIQADGVPMSGGKDDFNTTLQAIAIADIIQKKLSKKEKREIKILLSGGTNGKTGEMANLCGIKFNGVSLGTHGRKIVKPYIQNDLNKDDISEAVTIARNLIENNLL